MNTVVMVEYLLTAIKLWWEDFDSLPVTAGLVAMVVASLRMRQLGDFNWSEAFLCGIMATIATTSMVFLSDVLGINIPIELSSGVGGAIGWYGTESTVSFIERKFNKGDKRNDYD